MIVRDLFDVLTQAMLDEAVAERDEARDVVSRIAEAAGVDLREDVENNGQIWSHANMLRVLRAVQQNEISLSRHRGTHAGFHRPLR